MGRPAFAPAVEQPVPARLFIEGHLVEHEIEGAGRQADPFRPVQDRAGERQGVDHVAVPVGEDLVVQAGPRPRRAGVEQDGPAAFEHRLVVRVAQHRPLGAVEDDLAFPVAVGRNVVGLAESRGVAAQQLLDLALRPDVEFALLALAVGVERAGEGAAVDEHFPGQPGHGLVGADAVEVGARPGPGMGQQFEDLRIVVEHLLEMRREPERVGRIARIAAAEMVVDAALGHAVEQQQDGVAVLRIAGLGVSAPDQVEHGALGKFRRAAEAAMGVVHAAEQEIGDLQEGLARDRAAGLVDAEAGERRFQGFGVGADLVALVAVDRRDAVEHPGKAGPAPAVLRREIGAAPEGLALRRQEHGERPAALLAEQRQGVLVDLVDVRPLLPVDLDVDEIAVHCRSDAAVLEALVGHDVAPVAGRIADGQQDRLARPRRRRKGRVGPGLPVHRIVLVLQQVGAGLGAEGVGGGGVGRCHGDGGQRKRARSAPGLYGVAQPPAAMSGAASDFRWVEWQRRILEVSRLVAPDGAERRSGAQGHRRRPCGRLWAPAQGRGDSPNLL